MSAPDVPRLLLFLATAPLLFLSLSRSGAEKLRDAPYSLAELLCPA